MNRRVLLLTDTLTDNCVSCRYFCVHGGLSPLAKTLDDIQELDRFREPGDEDGDAVFDLLWSDPNEDFSQDADVEDFDRNSDRGSGTFKYSYKAVTDFLSKNNLHSIVRAHEAQSQGFKLHTAEGEKREKEGTEGKKERKNM